MRILNNDPDGDYLKYGVFVTVCFVIPYRMILGLMAIAGIAFVYVVAAVVLCVAFMILVRAILALSSPLHYVW